MWSKIWLMTTRAESAHPSTPSAWVESLEELGQELVDRLEQRDEDLVLAAEVVVERRLGDAEAVGDLAQRRAVVALLGEQLVGHRQDALAGVARSWHSRQYLLDDR